MTGSIRSDKRPLGVTGGRSGSQETARDDRAPGGRTVQGGETAAALGGRPSSARGGPAGVADGEHLPDMAFGLVPVDVLPAEAGVDFHVVRTVRLAAVLEPRRLDAAEDLVELLIAHVEAVVRGLELLPIAEVEGQRLVDVDGREMAPLFPGYAQELAQEPGGGVLIVGRDDDVVQEY